MFSGLFSGFLGQFGIFFIINIVIQFVKGIFGWGATG